AKENAKGGATMRSSESRREGSQARRGGETRTMIHANVRGGDVTHSRRTGSRTTIRTRVGGGDDIYLRRHHRRHYVYGEPSRIYIKHKRVRHYSYSEPSSVVIKRKHRFVEGGGVSVTHRHAGASIGVNTSTRTTVREHARTGGSINAQ